MSEREREREREKIKNSRKKYILFILWMKYKWEREREKKNFHKFHTTWSLKHTHTCRYSICIYICKYIIIITHINIKFDQIETYVKAACKVFSSSNSIY